MDWPLVSFASHHPCLAPGTPYNDYEQIHQLHVVSAGSRARLQENHKLLSEVKFAVQHTQRRPRELTLIKCTRKNCTFCTAHPVLRTTQAMKEIRVN